MGWASRWISDIDLDRSRACFQLVDQKTRRDRVRRHATRELPRGDWNRNLEHRISIGKYSPAGRGMSHEAFHFGRSSCARLGDDWRAMSDAASRPRESCYSRIALRGSRPRHRLLPAHASTVSSCAPLRSSRCCVLATGRCPTPLSHRGGSVASAVRTESRSVLA